MTSKVQRKTGKLDFIKIKIFFTSNNTIRIVKRYLIKCEKILANHLKYLVIVFIMYKEILQVNNKMTNNLIFNWAKDLNTVSPKKI